MVFQDRVCEIILPRLQKRSVLEENGQLKNQRNIIDNLAKENMKLRSENNLLKNLYYLRDRDEIDKPQFVKRHKAKN